MGYIFIGKNFTFKYFYTKQYILMFMHICRISLP